MLHFGVNLIDKGKSFKLIKSEFALIDTKPSLPHFESLARKNAYVDKKGSLYSEDWCKEYRVLCLKNYDINMEYFSKLDKLDFESSLDTFLFQYNQFAEVKNLNEYDGVEGYYIMVLDEYKQVYIGKTENIKRRIVNHWSKTRAFDRVLFPMYAWDKSVFSIDFFRACDTTRIFAWRRKISDGIESELISSFPARFCTNRIGGDITNAVLVLNTIKKR